MISKNTVLTNESLYDVFMFVRMKSQQPVNFLDYIRLRSKREFIELSKRIAGSLKTGRGSVRKNNCQLKFLEELQMFNMLPEEQICQWACKVDRIRYLRWAHERDYYWDENCVTESAFSGSLDCLIYTCNNGCPIPSYVTSYAALGGHIDCLKFLQKIGCEFTTYTIACSVWNGKLECLKWLHENGCPYDDTVTLWAAGKGYNDCLEYAIQSGFPEHANIEYHKNLHSYVESMMYDKLGTLTVSC